MLRSLLLAVLAVISISPSANAQGNFYDDFLDYRIEVRQKRTSGYSVFLDTHEPFRYPQQVNRVWRVFHSQAQMTEYFSDNSQYELLEVHHASIEPSHWMGVDTLENYVDAERKVQMMQSKDFRVDARIVPIYSPILNGPLRSNSFKFP